MKMLEKLPPYFQAREDYLRAMARYENQQRKLFGLFNVSNAAALEQALLENSHLHLEERQQYNILAYQADKACDIYDQATVKQKQAIAAQQKQYDAILEALDE
jgi:uncharacterized protein (DUF1778 family)